MYHTLGAAAWPRSRTPDGANVIVADSTPEGLRLTRDFLFTHPSTERRVRVPYARDEDGALYYFPQHAPPSARVMAHVALFRPEELQERVIDVEERYHIMKGCSFTHDDVADLLTGLTPVQTRALAHLEARTPPNTLEAREIPLDEVVANVVWHTHRSRDEVRREILRLADPDLNNLPLVRTDVHTRWIGSSSGPPPEHLLVSLLRKDWRVPDVPPIVNHLDGALAIVNARECFVARLREMIGAGESRGKTPSPPPRPTVDYPNFQGAIRRLDERRYEYRPYDQHVALEEPPEGSFAENGRVLAPRPRPKRVFEIHLRTDEGTFTDLESYLDAWTKARVKRMRTSKTEREAEALRAIRAVDEELRVMHTRVDESIEHKQAYDAKFDERQEMAAALEALRNADLIVEYLHGDSEHAFGTDLESEREVD